MPLSDIPPLRQIFEVLSSKETGVHTNSIEGKWAGLKRQITLRGRVSETLPGYLFERIWRHRNKDKLWKSFLNALSEIYYE